MVPYQANAAMEDEMDGKMMAKYVTGTYSPKDDKPFGGDEVGTYKIRVKEN